MLQNRVISPERRKSMNNFLPYSSKNHLGPRGLFGLGLILIALSIIALVTPFYTSLTITIILGAMMLATGISYILHALHNKKEFLFSIISALVNIIAGTLILINPAIGLLTVTLVLALVIGMQGIMKIITALHLGADKGGFFLGVSGAISLLLGILIWSGWPSTAAWVLALFLSIDLFTVGCSLLFLSRMLQKTKND